jgi:hypothetical protein
MKDNGHDIIVSFVRSWTSISFIKQSKHFRRTQLVLYLNNHGLNKLKGERHRLLFSQESAFTCSLLDHKWSKHRPVCTSCFDPSRQQLVECLAILGNREAKAPTTRCIDLPGSCLCWGFSRANPSAIALPTICVGAHEAYWKSRLQR